jgi:hypothetical protein
MRWRWWIAISVLGCSLLLLAVGRPQREPSYQGKPLRVWLKGFESESPEAHWRSAEAIRQIGTNAVPSLIAQLRHKQTIKEPRWKQELRTWLAKQSLIKINLPHPISERRQALAALDALGPKAKDATPALELLLHETPPDPQALLVLARIGPEAIPALTRALTNDEKVIRFGARSCLDMIHSHSEILFPKTTQDAEFMRRTCQFNVTLLHAAFESYRARNPGQFLPGSPEAMPPPSLPQDFVPPSPPQTNERAASLPKAAAGFE